MAVSSCADDGDTTACMTGLKADVSLSSLDHGINKSAICDTSHVIEICPEEVHVVGMVYL